MKKPNKTTLKKPAVKAKAMRTAPKVSEAPRAKRKYTRKAKPEAAVDPVAAKMADVGADGFCAESGFFTGAPSSATRKAKPESIVMDDVKADAPGAEDTMKAWFSASSVPPATERSMVIEDIETVGLMVTLDLKIVEAKKLNNLAHYEVLREIVSTIPKRVRDEHARRMRKAAADHMRSQATMVELGYTTAA